MGHTGRRRCGKDVAFVGLGRGCQPGHIHGEEDVFMHSVGNVLD
jgi:hypothetical protein